jgi:hypothetical protein
MGELGGCRLGCPSFTQYSEDEYCKISHNYEFTNIRMLGHTNLYPTHICECWVLANTHMCVLGNPDPTQNSVTNNKV